MSQNQILLCLICCLLLDDGFEQTTLAFHQSMCLASYLLNYQNDIQFPITWERQAFGTNCGYGRGRIKLNKRVVLQKKDVFSEFLDNPSMFPKFLFMDKQEFYHILSDLDHERIPLSQKTNLAMSFENKILLSLLFVIQYKGNKHLAYQFGVSEYYVSKVLDEILPILVEYFAGYIPNRQVESTHSRLHPQIQFIIDNTLHLCRKTRVNQSLLYNGHYNKHGYTSSLLVDYEGNVLAFKTLIYGKIHDALSANHNHLFRRIVGSFLFALSDTGFGGINYIVPGIKPTRVKTGGQKIYDKIARREQRRIEHINNYFKLCRSVNRLDTFYHSEDRLLACILIAIGMYNMKKAWGYYIKIK